MSLLHPILACFVSVGLVLAQRSIDELISALPGAEDPLPLQLELRARGADAAAPLGRAIRARWDRVGGASRAISAAARVLGELGPAGVAAFDDLLDCARDPDLPIADLGQATWALIRLAPYLPLVRRQALAEALRRPTAADGWRTEFLDWRGVLRPALEVDGAHATAAELLSLLADRNTRSQAVACRVIAARAKELTPFRSDLTKALADIVDLRFESRAWFGTVRRTDVGWFSEEDARILRTEASTSLRLLAPEHPGVSLALCQRLFDLDGAVRSDAARTLGARRDADAGIWLLQALRAERDPQIARAMLEAMLRIGTDLAHLAPQIDAAAEGLSDRPAHLARAIARSLDPAFDQRAPIPVTLEIVEPGLVGSTGIDLAAETARLVAWLDAEDGSNRRAIQSDERAIDDFQALASTDGGPISSAMRWVPMRIRPNGFVPDTWIDSVGDVVEGVVVASPRDAVGPHRVRLRALPWIVELIPVDRRRPCFTLDDLELRGDRRADRFEFVALRRADFEAFIQAAASRGGAIARLVGGLVVSADVARVGQSRGQLWFDPAAADRVEVARGMLQR